MRKPVDNAANFFIIALYGLIDRPVATFKQRTRTRERQVTLILNIARYR